MGIQKLSTIGFAAGVLVHGGVLAGQPEPDEPPVPFPHPVITEVFFNVPQPDEEFNYDANGDGERDARTDEFIELYNPHSKPISLEGYTLVSRLAWRDLNDRNKGNKGVRFTFPDFELEPGYAVVVFNTEARRLAGPVGTEERAARDTHSGFEEAYVFGVSTSSRNRALRNSGDFVLLLTPDNEPVDCVWWGNLDVELPEQTEVESDGADVEETVRTNYRAVEVDASPDGSVTRSPMSDEMVEHRGVGDGVFSPGAIVFPEDFEPSDEEGGE